MERLAGLLFLGIGILGLIFPTLAWYLGDGWKADGDAEPSDDNLIAARIGAGIAVLAGLFILLFGVPWRY